MNKHDGMSCLSRCLSMVICLTILASCSPTPEPKKVEKKVSKPPKTNGYLVGYLSQHELPRSDVFLPPAPLQGQATASSDESLARQAFAHRNSARWKLANLDANLQFPSAAKAFACTLGFEPTESNTPNLILLLRRAMADARLSTHAVKDKFKRVRPFVALKEQSCTPSTETMLAKSGSYPSAHAATGWTWALILAELVPNKQNVLLQRGYAFGQSRVHCGVHWQSDVDAGRVVGAATVAALHNNPSFIRQFNLAKTELASNNQKLVLPNSERCLAEQEALSSESISKTSPPQ